MAWPLLLLCCCLTGVMGSDLTFTAFQRSAPKEKDSGIEMTCDRIESKQHSKVYYIEGSYPECKLIMRHNLVSLSPRYLVKENGGIWMTETHPLQWPSIPSTVEFVVAADYVRVVTEPYPRCFGFVFDPKFGKRVGKYWSMPAYFLITVGYMELLLCYPYTWNMVGDGDRSEVSGDSLTIPRRPDDSLTGLRIWPPSTPVIRQKIDFDLVKHFHSFRFSVYSGHRYKLFARMSGHTNAEVIFKASPCVEVLKVKRDNVSPAHPHSVPRDDEAILEVFRFELLDQNPMQLTFWIDEKSQITTQNHPLSNQRVWKQRIDPNGIPATSTGGTLNNQSLGWNRQSLGWNRQSLGWNRQAHPSTMIPSTAVNGGLQMSARQRLPSVPLNQNAYHFQHQPVGQFTPPSMGHQTAALNHDLQHIMLLQAQLEKKRLQALQLLERKRLHAQLLLDGQATQRHPKNEQTRDGVGPLNRGVLMGLQYPTQDNGCPLRYENHEKQYPSTSNVNRMHGNSQANFQHQTLARTDHSDDPNYMQPHGS